jgi:signal transduction histidine kinase
MVAVLFGVLALVVAPTGFTLGVVLAVNVWSAGYAMLVTRNAGNWLLVADTVFVCVACLTQGWTAPLYSVDGTTSWTLGVTSIAVAIWQWHSSTRAGAIATAAVVLAYLAAAVPLPESAVIAAWLVTEAALSRGLYHLVRTGARDADLIMAGAERARRDATIAAARRADEREHLAAIHDTAAATVLAIGTRVVNGREPWLAKQLTDALAEITTGATTGQTDLVPLLTDVLRHSPVRASLSKKCDDRIELPAAVAVAVCRATREALANVARHAGVDTASVTLEHRPGQVVVDVTDRGRGFDPAAVPVHRRGIALSLVERMAAVGGRADITSVPGGGTRVRLEWVDG